MRVFLVNQNNPIAMSLVSKINNAKHGQLIPVTPEEWKFAKSGGLLSIDLPPDDAAQTAGTVAKKVELNAKVSPSPLPPDKAPKSPAA